MHTTRSRFYVIITMIHRRRDNDVHDFTPVMGKRNVYPKTYICIIVLSVVLLFVL